VYHAHIQHTQMLESNITSSYSLWNTINWSVAHQLRSVYCLDTKKHSRFVLKIKRYLAKNNNVFF